MIFVCTFAIPQNLLQHDVVASRGSYVNPFDCIIYIRSNSVWIFANLACVCACWYCHSIRDWVAHGIVVFKDTKSTSHSFSTLKWWFHAHARPHTFTHSHTSSSCHITLILLIERKNKCHIRVTRERVKNGLKEEVKVSYYTL